MPAPHLTGMLEPMHRSAYLGLFLLPTLTVGGCFSPDENITPAGGSTTDGGSSSSETDPLPTTGTTANPTGPTATGDTGTNPTDPTTPTGATDPTDPTDPTNTGTDSGSETGTPASCGDGNVDPDEDCDDGNDVNGDGCNSNCVESGVIDWESTFARGPMEATTLAVNDDGEVLVLGNSGSSEDVRYSDWRRLYAPNGDIVSTGDTGGFDASRITASGDTWLISYLDGVPDFGGPGASSHEFWGDFGIARVNALFDDEWSTVLPNHREIGQIHARENGGILVSGGVLNANNAYQYEHDGFLAAYNNGGALAWERLDPDDGGPRECQPAALLYSGGSVEACVRNYDEVVTRRRHDTGLLAVELPLGEVAQATDWTSYFSSDRYFPSMAAGPSGESAVVIRNRVFKFTPSTTLDWDIALNETGGERFYGIAIDSAGAVILAGRRESASGSDGLDAVIVKLDPEGNELWTHLIATEDDDEVRALALMPDDRIAFCATEHHGTDTPRLRVGVLTP